MVKKYLSKNKSTNFFVFNLVLALFLLVLSFPLYNFIILISGHEKKSLSDNNNVKDSIVMNPKNKPNPIIKDTWLDSINTLKIFFLYFVNKKIDIVTLKKNCLQKSICHGFCVSKDLIIKPPKLTKKTPAKIIDIPIKFLLFFKFLFIHPIW